MVFGDNNWESLSSEGLVSVLNSLKESLYLDSLIYWRFYLLSHDQSRSHNGSLLVVKLGSWLNLAVGSDRLRRGKMEREQGEKDE